MHFFFHGSPNSCCTTILIANNTNCTLFSTIPDPLGRVIINIYAPNKDKGLILFLRKLQVFEFSKLKASTYFS